MGCDIGITVSLFTSDHPENGQRAQHHLVEQGEDRGVGPAAERQREDHDPREGRVLPEDAQRQLQVLAESAHARGSSVPLGGGTPWWAEWRVSCHGACLRNR
jgi:hypothetical protein